MATVRMASTLLTSEEKKERLESLVQVTLDNFSMARYLANVLIHYRNANQLPPRVTVYLEGHLPTTFIPGTNCGFFVTTVFCMAMLDCRRSLDFFGLNCDGDTHQLVPRPESRRYDDDLGIENFGLAKVTRDQFLNAVTSISTDPEPILFQVREWSNKQLAHFTTSERDVQIPAIRDMSIIMIEAYMSLLFDAFGLTRPSINPSLAG